MNHKLRLLGSNLGCVNLEESLEYVYAINKKKGGFVLKTKPPFLKLLYLFYFKNSMTPAMPWPPPTHAVTIPYFLFWRLISLISWIESFAPVHPRG